MKTLLALQFRGNELADRIHEAWARGDAVLPLDPDTPEPELARILDSTKPEKIAGGKSELSLDGGVPADESLAAVVVTSGTGGEPKGVALSWRALEASARASLDRLGATDGERWLACVPLHHIAGLAILVRSRLLGSVPVVHDRFDVKAFEKVRDAAYVSLVPTMLARLLDASADLRRFKAILLGGAAPSPSIVDRARNEGANIVITYGMTETCGGCVYDGVPLDRVELRLGDEGEVMIRGPVLMDGYRLRPDLTRAAMPGDWLVTSDLGEIDDDGILKSVGRADDLIVTGGKKVAPIEVEDVLAQHPGVEDVAVIASQDPEWGEIVVAFVVARRGMPVSEESLREYARAMMTPFKIPREIRFLPEIPRNQAGKARKDALRALL